MAKSIFFLISVLALLSTGTVAADIRTRTALFRSQPTPEAADIPFTTYFEVKNPISLPNTKPCSYLVLQHDFAYTYTQPPVLADYKPPTNCPSQDFEKVVLEWTATSKGRQFDRIFGVWLSGVEILRSCTAEPRATGTVWTVKKDITRYKSMLFSNQTLSVYLGNIVDSTYTGVYHVKISIHFYPAETETKRIGSDNDYGSGADLIIPISRTLPLNDGLWFEIVNASDIATKEFNIPRNTYRAVLEVYVSFHENDEFWYSNYPNDYISANKLFDAAGNGPFREVLVKLDGLVAGAVWPFTVIYTGGINPLLWRPITGIGSFDLPSYDIEITPLLSKLLDGEIHKLSFSVTNALNVWYIDANLHLWLDPKQKNTQGKLLQYSSSPLLYSLHSNFSGLDGSFVTNVSRMIDSSGYVNSSQGLVITRFLQEFKYSNFMVIGNDRELQIVNQIITLNNTLNIKTSDSFVTSTKSPREFNLYLYMNTIPKGNITAEVANVSLGFKETTKKASDSRIRTTRLWNLQDGQGAILVKGNLVVSGVGSTQHQLFYKGENSCYFKNVSSSNYTILYDKEISECIQEKKLHSVPRQSLLGSPFPSLK